MRHMKNLTRRDWLIVNALLWLGMVTLLAGFSVMPSKVEPLQVGPLVPATAEESRQWERDNLADTMKAMR